jgi:release factor glutamine methyltransferase
MQDPKPREREQWTIRDVLGWTSKRFSEVVFPTPLLDAQLLLCRVLGLDKVQLYMQMDRPLTQDERAAYRALVQRRLAGEPVAYILEKKYWHDLELKVDGRVLIPRPETETLLDFVLAVLQHAKRKPARILDLCTGSGCLAIALARSFPDTKVIAVDKHASALAVARANVEAYGLQNLELIESDLLLPAAYAQLNQAGGAFDVVVANPPYLSEAEWQTIDGGVRNFEPKEALVADGAGLTIAAAILDGIMAHQLLESQSVFCMETGVGHGRQLCANQAASSEAFRVMAFHAPIWDLPRGGFFGLRDLEAKERFVCRLAGMESPAEEPVSDLNPDLDEA